MWVCLDVRQPAIAGVIRWAGCDGDGQAGKLTVPSRAEDHMD